MKTRVLKNALIENGQLDKLKKVVSGSEKLSESQLRNVAAGSEDDPTCGIAVGPPCGIAVGPPNQSSEEQSNQENQIW